MRAAAAAIVATLVAGIGGLVLSDPASADIHIEFVDGYVEVVLGGTDSTASEVLKALRDAGLDATVTPSPTGPSNVGRFTSAVISGGRRSDVVDEIDRTGLSFSGFRVPVAWTGELELYIGRLARPGEFYDASTNPFDELEPLHCAGVLGDRLASVTSKIAAFEVTVVVEGPQGPLGELMLEEALATGYGGYYVDGGSSTRADRVRLTIRTAPTAPEEQC